MRTDLEHLPYGKRRELERVVALLFEEFGDATALAQQAWRKQARILKIILFGSYARGGWVDEPHTAKGYKSDFDLLIIVDRRELTDRATYWHRADERLVREMTIVGSIHTPVNFIVHTLQEVNGALAQGQFFFADIARDGIAIYDGDGKQLSQPHPQSPQEALAAALGFYNEWVPSARQFWIQGMEAIQRGWYKKAAFELHQSVERLYHCVLLVLTSYAPNMHNLSFLRSQAERIAPELVDAWPRESRIDRARFEKLKEAYVKARYSPHYEIDVEALEWLGSRSDELFRLIESLCEKTIEKLQGAAYAEKS